MAEAGRVELTVLGQTLSLRTDASPDYLRRLAGFVEERVGELQRAGVKDPLKALTLAALDIADELHRARDDQSRDDGEVQARLGVLVRLLEEAVARPGSR